jgi:hypothetical protein
MRLQQVQVKERLGHKRVATTCSGRDHLHGKYDEQDKSAYDE